MGCSFSAIMIEFIGIGLSIYRPSRGQEGGLRPRRSRAPAGRGHRESRSSRRILALAAVIVIYPAPVAAQDLWTEASMVGYGATAVGLSIAACWSCDYDTFGVLVLAAAVGGVVLGHRIGGSAEEAARTGHRLTAAQLWGARVGTVTGFAALGASLAGVIINETEGNAEGEDERRILTYTLVGAGVGVIVEAIQESGLSENVATALRRISVEPTTRGAALGVRLIGRHHGRGLY